MPGKLFILFVNVLKCSDVCYSFVNANVYLTKK